MFNRRYTIFHFALDITLSYVTNGLWLIWVFIREVQNVKKK